MEFNDKRLLGIDETDENFADISFVTGVQNTNTSPYESSVHVTKLLEEIKKNIHGCDLILCFFIAALQSYRTDRCLRPFPPFYINEDGKNFNGLRETCDDIPALHNVLIEPKNCTDRVLQLLTWLFLEKNNTVLKQIQYEAVPFPSECSRAFRPHFVFEVCYQDKVEENWRKRAGSREIIVAYHGSAVDNFYSILKVGLQQHFSLEREVLFGNGIYLSNEVSVSAHYSPFCQTWKNSSLGSKHSVIAICEIINDVEKVKCKDTENKSRAVNKGGLGEIPEKYFVVTDSDMVRVKYLMVYRKKSSFSVKNQFFYHICVSLLVVYVLIIVGVFNNLNILRPFKWFSQFQ